MAVLGSGLWHYAPGCISQSIEYVEVQGITPCREIPQQLSSTYFSSAFSELLLSVCTPAPTVYYFTRPDLHASLSIELALSCMKELLRSKGKSPGVGAWQPQVKGGLAIDFIHGQGHRCRLGSGSTPNIFEQKIIVLGSLKRLHTRMMNIFVIQMFMAALFGGSTTWNCTGFGVVNSATNLPANYP